jgi:hypothetical protein
MSNFPFDNFNIILLGSLTIIITGIIVSVLLYCNCLNDNIYKKPKNIEIIKIIDTMKNDLITNKDKYSFIEVNDIINIIVDIYVKNECEYNYNDNINNFMEKKRENIIKEVKIKMLINYKNEVINNIIIEKNLLNSTLTITDLQNIKDNIENHKKEINNLFDLVNEINIIDIRIYND